MASRRAPVGAPEVRLTPAEVGQVTLQAGRAFKGSGGRTVFESGQGPNLPTRHLEGAGARFALAKHLDRKLQVIEHTYWTSNPNGGLILRADEARGVWTLVIGTMKTGYTLAGWSFARDVVGRDEWWDKGKPGGWYMPPLVDGERFHPMSTYGGAG